MRSYWKLGSKTDSMPGPLNWAELEAEKLFPPYSVRALYLFEDILELAIEPRVGKKGETQYGAFKDHGPIVVPVIEPTLSQFTNYFKVAIKKHYLNYERTLSRRHKEKPADVFYTYAAKDPDTAFDWEASLVDKSIGQEEISSIREFERGLRGVLKSTHTSSGVSLEVKEGVIFSFISQGHPLSRALQLSKVPSDACRTVLRKALKLRTAFLS